MRKAIGAVALACWAAACADRQADHSGDPGGEAGGPPAAGAGGSLQGDGGSGGGGGPSGTGGAPAKPRLVQSGSRLEAIVYRGADGSQHPTGEWFDVQRGEACTYQPAADGQIRCLPKAPGGGGFTHFADACSSKPVVMLPAAPACGAPAVPPYVATVDDSCSPARRLYRVGAQLNPFAQYFVLTAGGQCQPYTVQSGLVPYAVGAEVPPADFVAATVERLAP